MAREASELSALLEFFQKERARASFEFLDNRESESEMNKLIKMHTIVCAIERVISDGSTEPEKEKSVYETRGLLSV